MNNKTKKFAILLGTVILAAGLTACGNSVNESPAASPTESSSPSSTPTPAPSESSSPSATPEPSASSSPSASPESEVIQVTGEYVGLADSHTVEIKVEDGAVNYQLGEGMDKAVEGLKAGDLVTFEYIKQSIEGSTDNQLIITKIEKK